MKKIANQKWVETYLRYVIPVVMIYTSFICIWNYVDIRTGEKGAIDALIIFLCSFLMIYGVKSLLSDLKLFGICWVLNNFFQRRIN